jgi:hypothetical protein
MVLDRKMTVNESQKFADIIKEDQYKENFVKGLQAQLSTSSDLRSAVNLDGSMNTDRVLPGYEWHEGVDTVAFTFAEFIPKKGLKQITTMQKVKNYAIQLFVFTIEVLFLPVALLFKLPIVKPTWLKPTHTFDHESDVLSEGGTRPLLVGPHHRRMKTALKKAEKSGKLDPDTLQVMQQKALLQGHGFSRKEINRLKLLEPGDKFNYKLDLATMYADEKDSQELEKDLDRMPQNYTLNGTQLTGDTTVDLKNMIKTEVGNDQKQKKYLQEIHTQRYLASISAEIIKRYHFSPSANSTGSVKFNTDTTRKTVTVEIHYRLVDLDTNSFHENGLDVKVVFPFDHKKGADVEWTVVAAKVSNQEQKAPTVQAPTVQASDGDAAAAFEPAKTSFSSRLQDFATSIRRFLKWLIPSSVKLE